MQDFHQALAAALDMIARGDAELLAIVMLSLKVSATATVIAMLIGAPLGALLAMTRFPGREGLVVLANALLGLPPVVVGLAVYLMLSRSGPLGFLGWLFTPAAMVVAQTVLALPIVIALTHRLTENLWHEHGDHLRIDGASRSRSIVELLRMGRAGLLTAFLFAFGRAISEVGAIIVVGGNIRGVTRTMTTAIALETSKGELALALGLGIILIALSIAVSAGAFILHRLTSRE
jgi:tungstate transport system permease protein